MKVIYAAADLEWARFKSVAERKTPPKQGQMIDTRLLQEC